MNISEEELVGQLGQWVCPAVLEGMISSSLKHDSMASKKKKKLQD